MKNLRPSLKPGGVVGIIEIDAEKTKSQRKLLGIKGRLTCDVIAEMKSAGYLFRESHDFLESRLFLTFSPLE
jgi:hypothetical protein